ncbi:MAG: response regulator transcription factor, partial [Gammaproteobacteria bacterium]
MKALIIDDHPVFIAALETLLKNMYQDIGIDTATSAEAALRHIEYHPDYQFILLDLTMPGLDGFAFLRALEQRKLPIPIIIISSCEVPETIHACINAGAVGYIPKSYDLEQMAQAIERIHDGEIYLPQALTQTSAQTDEAAVRRRCEQIGITTKTYQVLVWLAKGKTNKEIADELN